MEINGFNLDKYFKRIDTTKIYPPLLEKAYQLVYNCIQAGYPYYAISGFRDPEEQDKLYAIGRTEKLDRPIVTNAPGFKSYHNYGFAIDFCYDRDAKREGLQPGWDIKYYTLLADEAEKLGMFPGLRFKMQDGPHIQIPMNVSGLITMENNYKSGGIQLVWDEITKAFEKNPFYKKKWVKES